MKHFTTLLFLFVCLTVSCQELQKKFPVILDEYIKKEIDAKGLNRDDAILSLVISELAGGYEIEINTYEFLYSPHIDTLLMYKKVRVVIGASIKIKNQIDAFFVPIVDDRKLQPEEIYTIHEPLGKARFQINENDEICLISTSDDCYYRKKLKWKGLKIAKDLKLTKDILIKQQGESK